jgi:hypothetical protein
MISGVIKPAGMDEYMNTDTITLSVAGLTTLISTLYPIYKGLNDKERRMTMLEEKIINLTSRQASIEIELKSMDTKQDQLASEINDIKVTLGRIEERIITLLKRQNH